MASMTVELEGDPPVTTAATMTVACETKDGSGPEEVIARAKATCMVSNSVSQGFPVTVQTAA